ncbi:hypothetical protein EIN_482620 [Entamoeba invadens IP1]|uniref:Uncharacterized protein n=1 Tax=Entamoeba invadens IP1 TaxID=370355 RepID=A0A0A1U796_ENTIV|nr:hypothetical protein EIN_482620 [Entamoeba invadens IP1]ELP90198.1 hypothetical protein EIN_482620 [Entamoeba invadens IP1]|eukprot:XP_004256969.1 hypothetical protein EIN_482620 [Entamoeba invadens IP1]
MVEHFQILFTIVVVLSFIPFICIFTYKTSSNFKVTFNPNDGVCSNVFKYQPNNKRDLWLTAVGVISDSYYKKIMKEVSLVLGLAHSLIPHADKVIILFKGYNYSQLITLAHKNGFKTLEVDMSYIEKCQDASKRFLDSRNTSKITLKNTTGYLLVTFVMCSYLQTSLQHSRQMICFLHLSAFMAIITWMKGGFGQKVSNGYVKNSSLLINVGTTFGGTEQVLNYIRLMTETMKPQKYSEWGYDQAVHNYIFYTHYFNQKYNFYYENIKEKINKIKKNETQKVENDYTNKYQVPT